MRTHGRQLDEVLWPAARRAILGLLYGDTSRELHLREIARQIGMAPATVQREVIALAEAGILSRRRDGHQTYYSADDRCPIFSELRGLVLKTTGLAHILRAALASFADCIEAAFVFGSMADGTASSGSDVDLCIVGRVSMRELVGAIRPLRETLGREVNPAVFAPEEFAERRRMGDHFVSSVLSRPRIDVVGRADELGDLGR